MPSTPKSVKKRAFQHSRNGLREAILGLLAIRPMTGYDLTRSYQHALQLKQLRYKCLQYLHR